MRKISIVSVLLLVVLAFGLFPFAYAEKPNIETMKEAPDYIIEFKGNKLPKNAEAIIEECGGTPTFMLPDLALAGAMPNGDPAAFEKALAKEKAIKSFDHDYVLEVPGIIVEPISEDLVVESFDPSITDFFFFYQWHLWHTIDADEAWSSFTTGSSDIKVAICDTGVDYRHPDIAPNYAYGISFVPYEDEMDYDGHGTWCAGMVAAALNDYGTVGVGPDLTIVNLKVLDSTGSGYFSWIFEAVYYAVLSGDIAVISMSLGGYLPAGAGGGSFLGYCNKVFTYAQRNGIVCVGSAGNQGWDMDWVHAYYVHLPSQCPGVIDVMGTDIYDDLAHTAWSSNYGSCLHGIAAPGGDLAFIEPEWYKPIIPPADWSPIYGACFSTYLVIGGVPYWAWMGGTSMAAPHVAGVAGLILSLNPNLNPQDVREFLFNGAVDIGPEGYDQYFNHGLLNAFNSLEDVVGS